MEWVETTGRTIEDAKEAALDELGVDESDAEFEVLEEARAGLFGRLRSEARVRARVRPTAPRAKEDRRDRRRRNRASGEETGAHRAESTVGAERANRASGGDSPAQVVAVGTGGTSPVAVGAGVDRRTRLARPKWAPRQSTMRATIKQGTTSSGRATTWR